LPQKISSDETKLQLAANVDDIPIAVLNRNAGPLQPSLRRIFPACLPGNRILAIRPVLSWATRTFRTFPQNLACGADRSIATSRAAD
jgi:hypothetical protein